MNAIAPVLHFGHTQPESHAIVDGGRILTYGELSALVGRTAGHLSALGLKRGERVGLCLKDTADQLVALLSIWSMGAVAIPLDWRARPAENGRFIDSLGLFWVLSEPDGRITPRPGLLLLDAAWHEAVSQATAIDAVKTDNSAAFAISASSGSTGAPKFTSMTHLQFHFAMAGMLELMDLSGPHRFLCPMPLYYSGGRNSCLAHLLRGDCVVLYPNLFTAAEYVEAIEHHHITVAGVVPSVVRQLLASQGEEPLLPSLTTFFSTGATLHAEEKREAARRLTPNFHERYGTAETMAVSVLRPADFIARIDSVGRPHSFVQVEVVDKDGLPLPAEVVGRLRLRGPGLASPLPGDASTNFRDGWYYPGEIARLDQDGYIFLQGRTSDLIFRNGAKVYPAEVERTLLDHPRVLEVAVLGHRQPDDADTEQAVVAFVVPNGNLTVGELLIHCRTLLSSHKVPRKIYVVEQLPKNTAGKIDKLALAKLLTG